MFQYVPFFILKKMTEGWSDFAQVAEFGFIVQERYQCMNQVVFLSSFLSPMQY